MTTATGMGASSAPKKIAILGGGISALTTAFEITRQPDWQSQYDITLYQMGWRLGGKCATARGENMRIEEHGIHGFLGSYYNALPLMADCYKALARPPGTPLATFDEAFKPENFVLMWEYVDGKMLRWPFTSPANSLDPSDPTALPTIEHWLHAIIGLVRKLWGDHHGDIAPSVPAHAVGSLLLRELEDVLKGAIDGFEAIGSAVLGLIERVWNWLKEHLSHLVEGNTTLRRIYIVSEYLFALVAGTLKDDIINKGFDSIDGENFSDWLMRHGASVLTASSPLALNTVNLSYQYPDGDTARTASMAAGAYLHWSLRSFAFMGSFAYMFEAGTGETVIAPLYEVLKKRGVKFEFFHKVESMTMNAAQNELASVTMGVQATLKAPAAGYQPTFVVQGLDAWPGKPFFDQLVEGDELQTQDIDLESYWTPWQPVAQKTLVAGVDFDQVVFAISIGAIPHLCQNIVAAKTAWANMVAGIPAVRTQTMQLWMNRTTPELGWDITFKNPHDTVIGATYMNPLDGHVDFTHLLKWECWPANAMPKSLWYFSGAMAQYDEPPPFSDHGYPAREHARVKAQCIQYLQVAIGPLLPKATTNVISPPGDPLGLDFSLLQPYNQASAGKGVKQFDQQFWRANIDPSERYVTSPPGSTQWRLKAWGSGLANMVLAGDWIYTGLNVGSVEGAVMGGKLAAHAVCGFPKLTDIVGYPAQNGSVVN